MSQTYSAADQAVLSRIVEKRAFRALLDLPLLAWQELVIVLLCYATVIGGAALYLNGVLPYPLVLLASGFAIYAVFTPLHDSTHRSVSRNSVLNDLIGTLAGNLMVPGVTVSVYRYLHLEHHRHTGDPLRDPDEFLPAAGPLGRVLLPMFVELRWTYWYIKNLDNRAMADRWQDLASLLFYVGWHVAWFASPYALEFLLLWVLPQRLGLGIVATLFATIQHPKGVLQSEHPLQASRMFHDGPLLRLAMLSQSQHLMHHMFPMVPFYRYNAVWRLAEPEMRDQELVWAHVHKPLVEPPVLESREDLTVCIDSVDAVTADIRAYTLAAPNGDALPSFEPGAHIDVHIAPGLTRQYSLTGLADEGKYSIAVKREDQGRGGSRTLHQKFAAGQTLTISRPRNLFTLQENDQKSVLIAGGIGLTPILSMALACESQQRDYELHLCARNQAALPFSEQMQQRLNTERVHTWLDDNGGLQAESLPGYAPGSSLYLCGPAGFMRYIRKIAAQRGWPESAIHSEEFSAAADLSTGQAFSVELARSGEIIEVGANESLLDALQARQIPIEASCEQGLCGTCQCKVLDGEVEHRDRVFTPSQHAQGLMTSCVSRAQGGQRLKLDL